MRCVTSLWYMSRQIAHFFTQPPLVVARPLCMQKARNPSLRWSKSKESMHACTACTAWQALLLHASHVARVPCMDACCCVHAMHAAACIPHARHACCCVHRMHTACMHAYSCMNARTHAACLHAVCMHACMRYACMHCYACMQYACMRYACMRYACMHSCKRTAHAMHAAACMAAAG